MSVRGKHFAIRPSAPVFVPSPPGKTADCHGVVSGGSCKISGSKRLNTGIVKQRSFGAGRISGDSGVLREAVPSAEAGWFMAEGNRPLGTERFYIQQIVPDGDGHGRPEVLEAGHVGHLNRPLGRLLPCPHPPEFPEVLPDSSFGRCLPIQSVTNGTQHCGALFHQDSNGSNKSYPRQRDFNTYLPGRLAAQIVRPGAVAATNLRGDSNLRSNGVDGEFGKVRVSPGPDYSVSGGVLRFAEGVGFSSGRQIAGHFGPDYHIPEEERSFCSSVAFSVGETGFCDETDSFRASPQETFAEVFADEVVSRIGVVGGVVASRQRVDKSFGVVAGFKEHESGGSFDSLSANVDPLHGCELGGFRGLFGGRDSVGVLGAQGGGVTLQQPRAVGGGESGFSFQDQVVGSESVGVFRQHEHGGGHQQARRDEVMVPDKSGMGALGVVGQSTVSSPGSPYSREIECVGRLPQQGEPGHSGGMGCFAGSSGPCVGEMGTTGGGFVCHSPQSQAAQVCVPLSPSQGLEGECVQLELEGNVCLRLPSVGDPGGGAPEIDGRRGEDDPYCSDLAHEDLVPPAAAVGSGVSDPSSLEQGSASTNSFGVVSRQSRSVAASGVAVIQNAIRRRGFSEDVARRMSSNVRKSSELIYNSKWRIFDSYCQDKQVDPLKVELPFIADFFNWLFVHKQLSISTLQGYRTAIGRVLKKSAGLDMFEQDLIKDLFANFGLERPIKERQLPKWDLRLVLESLKNPPYEPLISSSVTFLARKTAFLLLLASGARRGEIHALEISSIVKLKQGKSWMLKPNPRFVAKNFRPQTGKGKFEGFTLKALKSYMAGEDGDESLCPVRALRWYIHKTERVRGHIDQLFVTNNVRGPVRPIHKNTLSSWIKKVIADAYGATERQGGSLLHRSVHEIRAVGASYAMFGNVSIEDILAQCRWAGPSTFAKHYLRRVSGENEGFRSLLPLQVAGAMLLD